MPRRVVKTFWLEAWTAHNLFEVFWHTAPKFPGVAMVANAPKRQLPEQKRTEQNRTEQATTE